VVALLLLVVSCAAVSAQYVVLQPTMMRSMMMSPMSSRLADEDLRKEG